MKLGLSGHLTKAFIRSPLTPLILLASLAVGLLALMVIPREEEPQISVPMVDVMIQTDGLRAADGVELVTEPLEAIIRSIDGVEHVYSQTSDDQVMVTARFDVGTDPDAAILRVHERIRANMDRIPHGIPEPLVVGRGIDDVAIVSLTLSPRADEAGHWDDNALYNIVEELRAALLSVEDVGLTYIVGGRADQIRIEPDPERLSQYGITLQQLAGRIAEANAADLLQGRRVEDVAQALSGRRLVIGADKAQRLVAGEGAHGVSLGSRRVPARSAAIALAGRASRQGASC